MTRFSSTFILFLLLSLYAPALYGQYYFDKLSRENGLSDNNVTCFLKDKSGYLWIGTRNGLNRYDGHSFKIFRPGTGNSISSETINDIVQDSSGKIWVATMEGLNIYDPATNHWEVMMPSNTDSKNDIPSYFIWDLYVDKQNKIWIVCDVWELSMYDPTTQKFTYYDWPTYNRQEIFGEKTKYKSIQRIEFKNENEWWLGTSIGLFSVDKRSSKFSFYGRYDKGTKDLKSDRNSGMVFSVTETGNLFCYDERRNSFEEIKTSYQAYPVRELKRKNDQDLPVLTTHPDGILEINPVTKEAIIITHQPTLASTILQGGSNSIYTDNTGIVWIGTTNGVNIYNSLNQSADFIPLMAVSDHQSVDGMTAAVYDAIEKKYYITSFYSKKLFIIDDISGMITSISSIDGKSLSGCTNICIDSRNTIWLLTETNVYQYDRIKKKFNLFPTPNNGELVTFTDIIEDKAGNYWLATWRKGVYRYRTKEKSFYQFIDNDNFYANAIMGLKSDPVDTAVWVGTFNTGVYRYDIRKNSFIQYRETPGNPDYLQLNLVQDMVAGNDGKLWLATYGAGLYVYRPGNVYEKSFTHITSKKGLFSNNFCSVVADDKNRIWLLSERGLSAVDSSGKFLYEVSGNPVMSFSNYATDVSIPKRIFYNASKKEILVPVAGGLLLYYPDKNIPSVDYPVVLTDILIEGRSVLYDSLYKNKKNIEISYRYNSLSFQFAALNYSVPGNKYYEYKLHGGESVWKALNGSNTVNFPDLVPGRYTFMVRAKDANGNLSGNIASFSFRIVPPFWKTWWFITILAGVIAFCLYKWITSLRIRIRSEKILNYFATSLYGQNTVEDILWDVARNCITQLNFHDCVIYQYDEQRKILVQKAAYGPKNVQWNEILNPIEIPLGQGITGSVAASGEAEIISDTSKDKRYIVDDNKRLSEITVPIMVDGKIFGVIDSEHPKKNFYTRKDLKLLKKIAGICSTKISRYLVEEKLRTRIARDLHDEMGSTLTSINIISKMAIEQSGGDEAQKNHFSHIKEYSGRMMESMSDMVWVINPANDSLDKMLLRMKEFAAEILEPARINYFFKGDDDWDAIKLNPEQRKDLYLIYKEALTNTAKYSKASEITITLEKQNDFLVMQIIDNGKGFDPNTVHKGNGLKNMRSRASQLKAEFQVCSGHAEGTGIHIRFPITQ